MLLLFTPPRLVPTRKRGCVQRYRICVEHRDAMSVVLKGQEQRFCQQCGTFHPISKFNGSRRSCRDRLRKHAIRRRKCSDGSRPASWHWEEELAGALGCAVLFPCCTAAWWLPVIPG
ncbi:hypothetical protein CHLNCDRAFT_28394 [Chlorella variabilis]|uniref:SBP-type domain-containing protein n=1 Tax=Chlorella variabilis TaxID=554065 RepID=E1ZST8_CHLVA|nr:hypothetical protein CHLNCDRAFT_28394 [Chlorella variabilis]EFN51095.1 hypothetical protein CHLNCDRAFT_28394 [Chlorella variabilis]|eukprot:XP_005843197.1 hypothetical protein CHLNCDRAFT_28394 [Chlorella variabilis]